MDSDLEQIRTDFMQQKRSEISCSSGLVMLDEGKEQLIETHDDFPDIQWNHSEIRNDIEDSIETVSKMEVEMDGDDEKINTKRLCLSR